MTKDSVSMHAYELKIEQYIRLDTIPRIGIKSLHKTAAHHQCELLDIIHLSTDQLQQSGWSVGQIEALQHTSAVLSAQVRSVFQWLSLSEHHHFISCCDAAFPAQLKELARAPLFILAKGDPHLLHQAQLAIVGTRSPSQYAKEVVNDLVAGIAKYTDASITSGMALGIDGFSHRASLHWDIPTIAVLGCGIDIVYPKRHRQLYNEIAEKGVIVSEFLPGTAPHASLFPRRNRIISGLSEGVIVIEAKIKSGSLVTTKYALEQNKEIFAVPSAIYNPNAEGCHFLIKSGAKLTETVQDIVDELPHLAKSKENTLFNSKSTKQTLASDPLLDSVSYNATSVDDIAKRTGMSIPDVLTQLLQYELRGIVASTPEGYVKLRG